MFQLRSIPVVALILLFVGAACKDKGRVIETIGKDTVTTEKFETYYSAYIEKASRFANADKETLYKLMCNPQMIPPDPTSQDLIAGLLPENNYEKYRELKIMEQAALAEGFQDRPVIKAILEQVYLEALAQLYFHEKMQGRIKISETDKEAKCKMLREKKPEIMAGRTLDECLKMGEQAMRMEILQSELPKVRGDIKESVTIKKNNDFDRENYLKKELKQYQDIRKAGGCPAESAEAPKSESK